MIVTQPALFLFVCFARDAHFIMKPATHSARHASINFLKITLTLNFKQFRHTQIFIRVSEILNFDVKDFIMKVILLDLASGFFV